MILGEWADAEGKIYRTVHRQREFPTLKMIFAE